MSNPSEVMSVGDQALHEPGAYRSIENSREPDNLIPEQQVPVQLTKAFATLRARAGLAGWTLAPEGSSFLAVRLGQERRFKDLAAVETFLRQIGAPK